MNKFVEGCQKYWYEYFVTVTVNIMTMVAAIALVWTNPAFQWFKENNPYTKNPQLTAEEESQIASCLSIGIFMSTTTSGIVADIIGRKCTLLIYSLPMIASDSIYFVATKVEHIYLARILVGIGVGAVWTVTPMYTGEIATTENRGLISVLLVVLTTGAQLFLYIIVPFSSLQGIATITLAMTGTFIVLTILFVPESPYYYAVGKKVDKIEHILVTLRRKDDVKEELAEILKSVDAAKVKKSHEESWTQIFTNKVVLKSLLIVMGLLFFNQNTGTVTFSLFIQKIFEATETILPADKCVIAVTFLTLLVLLSVSKIIDAVQRKVLLIISIVGVIIANFVLGTYFYLKEHQHNMDSAFWVPLVALMGYQTFVNIGIAPLCFVIAGEIFPANHLRTYLNGISFTFFIILGFIFSHFPSFEEYFHNSSVIFFFATVSCFCIPFILFCVPETKGKTFLEIQAMLQEGRLS